MCYILRSLFRCSRKNGFFREFCVHTGVWREFRAGRAPKYHQFWPVKAKNNWNMSLCCNAHQIDVIVAVCAYTVLILGTWRVDAVVKPFKLLAVFVHEGCHACACLATGGRVDGVDGESCGSSSRWACGREASATSCCTSVATSTCEGLASAASRRRRGDNLISYPRVCRHASSICRRRTRREARRAALVDRRHRLQHAAIDSAALGSRRHRCGCRHPHHHRCERSSSSSSLPKQTAKRRSGPAASAS